MSPWLISVTMAPRTYRKDSFMPHSMPEHTNTIFYEMMSHPALFTHPHPKKIIIIADEDNRILQEVIKHDHLAEIVIINKTTSSTTIPIDPKIQVRSGELSNELKKAAPHSIDIIIHAAPASNELLKTFFTLLSNNGILMQQSASPFELSAIKSTADQLRQNGFQDQQMLHFPQPGFSSGWRSIMMATKKIGFKRIREKAIFARSFKTYYYNLDTHKASLVLPEFIREEWTI